MAGFKLGPTSLLKLQRPGVHPDLVKLILYVASISPVSFVVAQGLRTREEQFALWASSHSLDGRPIHGEPWKTNCNGTPKGQDTPEGAHGTGESNHQDGHAVDLAIIRDGVVVSEERPYEKLNDIVQLASKELNIPVVWGATFPKPDSDHWELNRNFYPRKGN